MQYFLFTLVMCSISMSLIALLIILITPLLSKRYTAKCCYYIWLIIIIGLIIPFRPQFSISLIQINTPTNPNNIIQYVTSTNTGIAAKDIVVSSTQNLTTFNTSWLQIITFIWLTVVLGIIIYHVLRHRKFMVVINRWSENIEDLHLLKELRQIKSSLNISSKVVLKICPCISSPMIIGFIKPIILLPTTKYTSNELALILKHELIHFKRRDLWYKALVITATTLHWFNPFVYKIAKAISILCESSCDEAVLQNTDLRTRRIYGETIIRTAKTQTEFKTALSVDFYGEKNIIKNRIFSIMDIRKKKTSSVIFFLILIATISTGIIATVNSQHNTISTPSKTISYITTKTTYPEFVQTYKDFKTSGNIIIMFDAKDSKKLYSLSADTFPISAMNAVDTCKFAVKAHAKSTILDVINYESLSKEKVDNIIMSILKNKIYTDKDKLKSDVKYSLEKHFGIDKDYFIIEVFEIE